MLFDWLQDIGLLPAQVSQHAAMVDSILLAFTLVLILFVAPVFVAMTWFAIKYRRGSPASRVGRPRGSPWIEAGWSLIPLAIMGVFFVQAARGYVDLHTARPGALKINVVAKQWMWKFQHPGGKRQINQLNVPMGVPVELNMISQDVIHSLYFPALRIKQDVLPGRYLKLRFTAERTGTYHLTCTEYCGTDHSRMGGSIVVMTEADYHAWRTREEGFVSAAENGRKLFRERDCGTCHGGDAPVAAPDIEGLYGRDVALANGSAVLADEEYIRRSIVLPNDQIVAGYRPAMPSYRNQLTEEQISDLIAYIRSLSNRGGAQR